MIERRADEPRFLTVPGIIYSLTMASAISVILGGCGHQEKQSAVPSTPHCLPVEIRRDGAALSVTNKDTQPWTDVEIVLNQSDDGSGGFRDIVASIEPGRTELVPFRDLLRSDGLRFDPEKYAILDLTIRAKEGDVAGEGDAVAIPWDCRLGESQQLIEPRRHSRFMRLLLERMKQKPQQ